MQPLDPMPSPHATRLTVSSFDQWREIIDTRFLPLDYARESHGRFHCEVSYARFGACAVADMQVSAHRVACLRRHAEDSDAGFFKVFWQLHGRSRVAQREHRPRSIPACGPSTTLPSPTASNWTTAPARWCCWCRRTGLRLARRRHGDGRPGAARRGRRAHRHVGAGRAAARQQHRPSARRPRAAGAAGLGGGTDGDGPAQRRQRRPARAGALTRRRSAPAAHPRTGGRAPARAELSAQHLAAALNISAARSTTCSARSARPRTPISSRAGCGRPRCGSRRTAGCSAASPKSPSRSALPTRPTSAACSTSASA